MNLTDNKERCPKKELSLASSFISSLSVLGREPSHVPRLLTSTVSLSTGGVSNHQTCDDFLFRNRKLIHNKLEIRNADTACSRLKYK